MHPGPGPRDALRRGVLHDLDRCLQDVPAAAVEEPQL